MSKRPAAAPEPSVTVAEVTPDEARHWLGTCNYANRKLRPERVRAYAEQMRRGQWHFAGDPIRFDMDGKLSDGQHRLAAVVAADMPVTFVIIRDLPVDTYKVIDSGLSRTYGDVLGSTHGAVQKAAAIRLLYAYELDADPRLRDSLSLITRIDVADYYAEHHSIIDAADKTAGRMYAAFRSGNKTAWTAFIIIVWRIDRDLADQFLNGVVSGANLGAGDARLALRNWLSNDRKLPGAGHYLGMYIKGWNAWLAGASRTIIAFRPDEPFPKPATVDNRRNPIAADDADAID